MLPVFFFSVIFEKNAISNVYYTFKTAAGSPMCQLLKHIWLKKKSKLLACKI